MNDFQNNLHERALEISKDFRKLETALIDILQKVDEAKVYLGLGYSSLFEYATEALELSESNAYTFTRLARKSKEVPALKEKIERGELCISNARQLIPILTAKNQDVWIQKAEAMTKRELEQEVARLHPEAVKRESIRFVREDRMSLRVEISDECSKKLKRVQTLLSSHQRKNISIEGALEAALDLFLEKKDPVKRAERIVLSKDKAGPKEIEKDPRESFSISFQNTGGKHLVPFLRGIREERVTDNHMQIRNSHSSLFSRNEGPNRDKGKCTYISGDGKKCGGDRYIEVHHRRPVSRGGTNSMENLTTLCSDHHQLQHFLMNPERMLIKERPTPQLQT